MSTLELLYFVAYSRSRSRDLLDLRFNPAAFLVLILQPIINSSISLLFDLTGHRHSIITNNKILYAKYDIWTYVSIALSAFFVWKYFDQNRAKILDRYLGFEISKKIQWSIIAFSGIYTILNFYLYIVDYYLFSILIFGVMVFAGHFLIKKEREKRRTK